VEPDRHCASDSQNHGKLRQPHRVSNRVPGRFVNLLAKRLDFDVVIVLFDFTGQVLNEPKWYAGHGALIAPC